jgi:hypothetical protein
MQSAPVTARVFALRQAFAEFASGKILRRFAEARIGRAKRTTSRGVSCASGKSFACSTTLDCECLVIDQRS